METTLERILERGVDIDDFTAFRRALAEADSILYVADNAGEMVFDCVLIQDLSTPVTYTVKAGPIINDATQEDALAAGRDQVAEIIPSKREDRLPCGFSSPTYSIRFCSESR